MDTNFKGKLVELQVLTKITELGYSVSIPFGDKDKYDQIWDINGKLIKVQVKSCRWKNAEQAGIIFNCYSVSNGKKHKYTEKDIDYYATYWQGKCYLVSVKECSQEKTLWFIPQKLNSCCQASDYEIEKVLTTI